MLTKLKTISIFASILMLLAGYSRAQNHIAGKGCNSIQNWNEPQGNPEDDDSLYLWKRANLYRDVDGRKGLDTMRLYVERHPYATIPPGEVVDGIAATVGFTGQLPNLSKKDWINEYDWLAKIQPVNPDRQYQLVVIYMLATTLQNFNFNEAANMWYNYSLIFNDSGGVALASERIRRIRDIQKHVSEDTTPFRVLTFPLKPLGTNVVAPGQAAKPNEGIISFTAGRNPFGDEVSLSAQLSASTMLHLAIFDELGRQLYSEGLGFAQAGEYSYRIAAKGWSSGVYYARLSTSGGEVRTGKLVKE